MSLCSLIELLEVFQKEKCLYMGKDGFSSCLQVNQQYNRSKSFCFFSVILMIVFAYIFCPRFPPRAANTVL